MKGHWFKNILLLWTFWASSGYAGEAEPILNPVLHFAEANQCKPEQLSVIVADLDRDGHDDVLIGDEQAMKHKWRDKDWEVFLFSNTGYMSASVANLDDQGRPAGDPSAYVTLDPYAARYQWIAEIARWGLLSYVLYRHEEVIDRVQRSVGSTCQMLAIYAENGRVYARPFGREIKFLARPNDSAEAIQLWKEFDERVGWSAGQKRFDDLEAEFKATAFRVAAWPPLVPVPATAPQPFDHPSNAAGWRWASPLLALKRDVLSSPAAPGLGLVIVLLLGAMSLITWRARRNRGRRMKP